MKPKPCCLLVLLAVSLGSSANAIPPFLKTFAGTYKVPYGSELFKARCTTCHIATGPPKHNPYGAALKLQVERSANKTLTVAMLKEVEAEDSDGDGFSNLAEIAAGTLPGEASSHPVKGAALPPVVTKKPQDGLARLIPGHSFHPLIVHFPIALFLFGVFLEALGHFRKLPELRTLAIWNLAFGAIASLGAVTTGIAAWLRLGFPLEGNVLTHLLLGSSSAILMCVIAIWRRQGVHDNKFYWFLLLLTAVAVGLTGHIGASIVYG